LVVDDDLRWFDLLTLILVLQLTNRPRSAIERPLIFALLNIPLRFSAESESDSAAKSPGMFIDGFIS
jgi:hypothetical protein